MTTVDDLVVDPVFSAPEQDGGPLRGMYPYQRDGLEKMILTDGEIRDPLSYWHEGGNGKPILIDGHTRLEIYNANKSVLPPPACVEITGPTTREEVIQWIRDNNKFRRGDVREIHLDLCLQVAPALIEAAAKRKAEGSAKGGQSNGDEGCDKAITTLTVPAKVHRVREQIRLEVEEICGSKPTQKVAKHAMDIINGKGEKANAAEKRAAKVASMAEADSNEVKNFFHSTLDKVSDGSVYPTDRLKDITGNMHLTTKFIAMCEVSPEVKLVRFYNGGKKSYVIERVDSGRDAMIDLAIECLSRLREKLEGLPASVADDITQLINLFCSKEDVDNG